MQTRHIEQRQDFRRVELVNVGLTAFGLECFGAALAVNRCVTHLVFDHNPLPAESLRAMFTKMTLNDTLEELSLRFCALTSEVGEALGWAIGSFGLKKLILDHNSIGCEGAVQLFNGLRLNPSLKILSLQDNAVDRFSGKITFQDTMLALARNLEANDTFSGLDLLDNNIGDDGGQCVLDFYAGRKAAGASTVAVRVCHRMSATMYKDISGKTKWPGGGGKKKGKKKKGGKKKKK